AEHAHGGLAAENRRGERIHWQRPAEIGFCVERRAQVRVGCDRYAADRDLARPRHIGSGRYAGVVVIGLESPARLERSRRQASEEAWNPEAHATLVGFRGAGAARPCNRPANERKPGRAVSAIALRDIKLPIADAKYTRHEPRLTQQCVPARKLYSTQANFMV